ncbi:MAG: hypothetical protein P4N60_01805 [Verrucomicrobiae bacterium]|nr:hypothetical protein [Verrucomicrobiae bacterium]
MIAVKIECDCGQHYAFDVEPVNGRMGTEVTCPACGVDGTGAANHVIAQKLGPPPSPPIDPDPVILIPPPQPRRVPASIALAPAPADLGLKINKTETAPVPEPRKIAVSDRELGIVSREQAETDARAKVSWGDSQEEVIKYLMLQRFTAQEATDLVGEIFKERLVTVRTNGVRKIIIGTSLMFVPIIAWIIFALIGVILLKLMAIAIMVGCYGFWLLINGIIALVAPKMESGDVAEQ